MEDPTRGLLGSTPPEAPAEAEPKAEGAVASPATPTGTNTGLSGDADRPSRDPRFIGDAMRSLYQSGESSIVRGDATRVISRDKADAPAPAASASQRPLAQPFSSAPPSPRVDVTLWVVLALGLFAIAGVMLSAAL
jgi:hypothetical protein